MKNVLYLSYDGMTDPLGQSQVLPYLIGLSRQGYRFTIISFEKADRFEQEQAHILEICRQNEIDWHPLPYTKKPPVISTLRDVLKMNSLAKKLHKEKHFSLVHCRSYLSALVGLGFKKKQSVPFLFDMRGFWADERIEGGIWKKSNPLFKFIYTYFKQKERVFFSGSDAIISLTHAGKSEILAWNLANVSSEKITVIPCCVDLNLFDHYAFSVENKVKERKRIGIEDNFIVGYVGSIGTWYQLDEMMLAFKQILTLKPKALFLFVTRETEQTIFRASDRLDILRSHIRVVSAIHHEVPNYISLFDCSIFFIRPSFSKIASSPTKQGEIMAMGIPVICNAGVGDTAMVVENYSSGQVVHSTDKSILKQFHMDLSGFNREKALLGAREFYGLENGVASYLKVYEEIGG